MKKWDILSSEYIVHNKPFNSLRRDKIRLPNGMEQFRYVNEYPHWVNAIVVTPNQSLVLVRQYRHGSEDFMLETPGGMVDDDESPVDAIIREVAEETGYHAQERPICLGEFYPNPATSNNTVGTYLFVNAEQTHDQQLDRTEDIEITLIPFKEFGEMIGRGQVPQMFAAFGYYLAKNRLNL